jgi:hypothetical protein
MHRTTRRFWTLFHGLPHPIQKIAEENFSLLKENPRHPSLHFKKIGKLWSVRVGLDYRALAVGDGSDFFWVWIGTHDEYNQMIKTMG